MGGGGGNLMIPLLLPIPPSVDEPLDTQLLSVVAFRGMSEHVNFDNSEPNAVKGCEKGEEGASTSISVDTVVLS